MTKKCICQICCCGRHRCPHNANNGSRVINKSKLDNCQVTEYGGRFQEFKVSRGPFKRPNDLIVATGQQDHTTIHKSNFTQHPLEVKHYKRIEEYIPNPEPMELDSEYKDMFLGKKTKAAKIPGYLRGITQRAPSGKISNETVHKNDFKPWGLQTKDTVRKKEYYMPPSEPFTDTSIHRSDFITFKHKRPAIAHQPDMIKLEGDFTMETSNMSDYKQYDHHPMFVKRKESYKPMVEPFTANSLVREDFPNHGHLPKTKRFQPVSKVFKSHSPIQYDTTHSMEYKNWKLNKRYQRQREPYVPPNGALYLETTSSDYCIFGQDGKAAKSARPKTILRTGRDGEFDGTSSYKETFQPWAVERARPIKLDDELRHSAPAALKFTDTSEHREKFKAHNALPAKTPRQKSTLFQTNARIDDVSQYKNDFKGKAIKDCPSHALMKLGELSGIKFEEDFDTGHRYVVGKQEHDTVLPPISDGTKIVSQPEPQLVIA